MEFLEELIFTEKRKSNLEKVLGQVGKMSTFNIACIVNYLVENMNPSNCYLNIGVWKGFTFFSGMVGNPDKICIGVDNFSEFGGPKNEFYPKFEELKSDKHEFYEIDFRKYFEIHKHTIEVYYYDAVHNLQSQYDGLAFAEPFFSQKCYILVDDWNWDFVKEATNKFISERKRYEIIYEKKTNYNGEPTFWNGLIVIRRR